MRAVAAFLAAMLGTYLLVWCAASIALRVTGVPKDFPPFTTLPLLSGVVGGFLGALAVHAVVSRLAAQPDRIFLFIAIATLALSFSLPLRLSFTKSQRFRGVTPSAQMTLALLHTFIATAAVTVLTRPERLP